MSELDRGEGIYTTPRKFSPKFREKSVELEVYISELQAKNRIPLDLTIFECIFKSLDFKLYILGCRPT